MTNWISVPFSHTTITMGFWHISHDVKLAAIWLHSLLSLVDILQSVGFSESTFYWILAHWRHCEAQEKSPRQTLNSWLWWYPLSSCTCMWQCQLLPWCIAWPPQDKLIYFCLLHHYPLRTWMSQGVLQKAQMHYSGKKWASLCCPRYWNGSVYTGTD